MLRLGEQMANGKWQVAKNKTTPDILEEVYLWTIIYLRTLRPNIIVISKCASSLVSIKKATFSFNWFHLQLALFVLYITCKHLFGEIE